METATGRLRKKVNMETDWLEAEYEDRTHIADDEYLDDEDDDGTDDEDDDGTDDEDALSIEEATEYIADAISEYGRPAWVSMVPGSIRQRVPLSVLAGFLATARPSEGWGRPRDGRDTILGWAKENIFAITTVKELAEIGGVSEATVRTLLGERPDIFRRSEGWKYEVRDPHADRAADKQ